MKTIRDFMKIISEGVVNETGKPGYKGHDGAIIQGGIKKINEVINLLELEGALFGEEFGWEKYEAFLNAAYNLGTQKDNAGE